MSKFDLTHARHDPAHCLAPGLFRSLKRGGRRHAKLDVTYTFGQDETMRFVCFEPLGADDMRFLQGIVALGGPNGVLLTPEPTNQTGQQLRLSLKMDEEALKLDGLIVRQSLSKLLSEIGMTDGGHNIRALKDSLLRMSAVTIQVTQGQRSASYHLMSHAYDEANGKLWVALNPRIAEAVLGRRPYARIDMAETRALKTNPARLMHQRMSGWIASGKTGLVTLDTLCGYVWPDPASSESAKKRHQTARKALAEIGGLGWTVTEYARNKWKITRPDPP